MTAKRVFLYLFLTSIALLFALQCWTRQAEQQVYKGPQGPRVDLTEILEKETLSEEDYRVLFDQTGMARAGVRSLWKQGRQWELLQVQERYFAPVQTVCRSNSVISREEKRVGESGEMCFEQVFPALEEGDVLITFNSHVAGWRCGHAALVVDVSRGQTLEARVLGTDSGLISLANWVDYPAVAVLRVRDLSREQRLELARMAEEYFVGIPYRVTAVKGEVRGLEATEADFAPKQPRGTHCAHLIWSIFAAAGIDTDSDGGPIVTPRDIFESKELELIQIYGMDPPGKS